MIGEASPIKLKTTITIITIKFTMMIIIPIITNKFTIMSIITTINIKFTIMIIMLITINSYYYFFVKAETTHLGWYRSEYFVMSLSVPP